MKGACGDPGDAVALLCVLNDKSFENEEAVSLSSKLMLAELPHLPPGMDITRVLLSST